MTDEVLTPSNLTLIESVDESLLVSTEVQREIVEMDGDMIVFVDEPDIEIVSIAEQGPPGPPGERGLSAGEEMAYSERTDFVGDDTIYRGDAQPGSSESAALWRIKRLDIGVDGDVKTTWANGSADFIHAWSDRASYIYS